MMRTAVFGPAARLVATTLLALSLAATVSAQAPAQGASSGTPPAPRGTAQAPRLTAPLRPEGGTQWSAFSGFGVNQQIFDSAAGIHLATGGVRWTHMWGENFGSFLRGHPSVALEFLPVMAFVGRGNTTWGIGANLLYEHHFATKGRVLPVWKFGVGLLYADREIPARETRFNFSAMTALGVDIMMSQRRALFLGYRFHHISNANTGPRNPGINVHAVIFGLSFYR